MERFTSEVLLRIDYEASNSLEAGYRVKMITQELEGLLLGSSSLRGTSPPTLVSSKHKIWTYQVLYLLYTDEPFNALRDRLSKYWTIKKKGEVVWQGAAKQNLSFLQMPFLQTVRLEVIRHKD